MNSSQQQFETRLLDSIMDQWTTAAPATPSHYQKMGRIGGPLVIAAAVAAFAFTALPATHGTNASPDRVPAPEQTAPATLDLSDPTLVSSAVNRAMTDNRQVVIHAKETTWRDEKQKHLLYVSEMWSDAAQPGFRMLQYENGKPRLDSGVGTKNGVKVSRQVDFTKRTVTDRLLPSDPSPGTVDNTGNLIGNLRSDTVVGHEQIDGVDTLHLLDSEPGMNREVWVDAQSLLPVRMTEHGSWGSSVFDYNWLPRTPENIALLLLSVPDGFTVIEKETENLDATNLETKSNEAVRIP